MHTTIPHVIRCLLLGALASAALPVAAEPFVYRGALTDRGEPAEGSYVFRLTFYDAEFGGQPLAAPITLADVRVVQGSFHTGLELEPALQRRDAAWLEVEVGDADGRFVPIAGRQAVQAQGLKAGGTCWDTTGNAGTVATVNFLGTTDGAALRMQSSGGVGINTSAPLGMLHVRNASAGVIAPVGGSAGVFEGNGHTYVSVFSPAASERGLLFGKPGTFNEAADGGIIYNNVNSATMQFRTGGNVTRMQLGVSDVDGSGGATSEPHLLLFGSGAERVYLRPSFDPVLGLSLLDIGFSGVPAQLRIHPLGAIVQGFFSVGISAQKPGGGPWSDSSDARLKTNIVPLDGALDRLLALRGVNFEYAEPDGAMHPPGVRTGFVAQEVQKVFPQWVQKGADGYLTVGSQGFEALAVEALRQLADENAQLQADNAQLHARLEQIEHRLARRARAAD